MIKPKTKNLRLHLSRRARISTLVSSGLSFVVIAAVAWTQLLPAQAASQSSLAGYWKFDESTAGAAAVDSSGNGNDLTPTNSPVPTTDIPGVMNQSIADSHSASFNGSTQYFSAADNSSLDNTGAVSVSTWVKFTNTTGNQTILAKWQVGVHQQWVLQLNSGHISWWTGDGYSGANELASSTAITAGTWYHLVATATSGSKKLYINGSLDTSNTAGAMGAATGTPLTIGSKPSSNGTYFEYLNGDVDDARVYTRVLSGTEVSSLASGSEANTLTGGSAVTNELGTTSAITDLQVISTGTNPTVYVKMYVGQGTISLSTTTGLTFYGADGSSLGSSQPANSASLHIGGSLSDVNNALKTLRYTRTTSGAGTDTLSASLVGPGEAFFSDNGHSYQYVAGPVTWSQAETAAAASSKYGAQGYLATITSQAENDFIATQLKSDSWIGASDSAVEGTWRWVTGPESGQQFWQGTGSGNTVNGMYAHWNNTQLGGTGAEPNQSGEEDCAEFYYANNGFWNDLSCTNTLGYIIEYGGLSGINPAVSSENVSITTADTLPPSKPGTPTATSPTSDTTPTVSWSASSDSGAGLANPAYTLEWSTSATFASVLGSATTNNTSLAPTLADGTWYFRVTATDGAGNATVSDTSSGITVDTTTPDAPGQPTTASPTNSTSPTWTWTAADDHGGSGIAPFGYTFEWSSTSDFSNIAGAISVSPTSAQASLSSGTWYTRVQAEDWTGHTSAWSPTGTVVIDTTAPTAPGQPLAAQHVTNDTTPDISWTAAKDKGSGLANPAYTLEWSMDPTFTTGTGSLTTNSTSVTIPTNLSTDGKWWLLLTATDNAGNTSTSGNSVIIDTTAPSTPAASPAGGTYTTTQTVLLSSSDNLTNADIYYTTDGSAPTSSSTQFHNASTPITISSSETLKAIAYDSLGNASPVMSETYTIGSLAAPSTDGTTPSNPSAATTGHVAPTSGAAPTAPPEDTVGDTDKTDTITLNSNTHKQAAPDTADQNTGAFLGLGWWWLPLLAIIAYLWFLLAGRRRKRDEQG